MELLKIFPVSRKPCYVPGRGTEHVTRQTKFPTIPLERIQHLIARAEILDAEDAAATCLNCGHPASDHAIENDTCWHTTTRDGKVKICSCQAWRQGGSGAGAAD